VQDGLLAEEAILAEVLRAVEVAHRTQERKARLGKQHRELFRGEGCHIDDILHVVVLFLSEPSHLNKRDKSLWREFWWRDIEDRRSKSRILYGSI